jgi:2-(1,2-epoxy-1,2-dihydrophenyl)acetyl-CoA isomerase
MAMAALVEAGRRVVTTIRGSSKPVIGCINGVAAGGGANLALACDMRIASDRAKLGQTFNRIGLCPDWGGTYFLPRLAGSARAMGLALLGEKLSAADAAAWGLIWRCVDDGELEEVTQKVARTLAQGPTRGLMRTKQALRHSLHSSFEEQLELERQVQRQCGFSHDYKEGVTAFLERRPPSFKGS